MNSKYLNMFQKETNKLNLYFDGKSIVGFNYKVALSLAKATGLRTKKSRKVLKRFKKVIVGALRETVTDTKKNESFSDISRKL